MVNYKKKCEKSMLNNESSIINVKFYKVDVHSLVFDLKLTPIFEWHIVGCESKNGHQKNVIKIKS